MRSEDLDPSRASSGLPRPGRRRGRFTAAVVGAVAVTAGTAAGLITAASSASATTITETFAAASATGPLELQVSESINQPATVTQGQNMTITVPSSSQAVPTTDSGVAVNYIAGLQTLIPVPANSTFVSGSIVAGTWSFKPAGGGTATTGPLTVTECTGPGTGCTATAHGTVYTGTPSGTTYTFLGNTSTPYLEATTGTAHFTAGGTLTLPTWSFDVTASGTGTIVSTVSEFDTSANVTVFNTALTATVDAYPAVAVAGCITPTTPSTCTSMPAYQFQPIATTTITAPGATTTSTTPGATTTTTPGATTTTTTASASTTTLGSSGGTTTTTVKQTTTGSGSGTTTTVAGGGTVSSASGSGTGGSGSDPAVQSPSVAAGSSSGSSGGGKGLAYTGPPKTVWILGIIGLGLLDLGYLSLSATWRARRSRRSTSG